MMKRIPLLLASLSLIALAACTTMPEPKHKTYSFPAGAYVQEPNRKYTTLGVVRAKVEFPTLDPNRDEKDLCRNYYNKAVADLMVYAKDQGADAVVDVKSVVFLQDGRREVYPTPECSDDGAEGQILTQGVAVKWADAKLDKRGLPEDWRQDDPDIAEREQKRKAEKQKAQPARSKARKHK